MATQSGFSWDESIACSTAASLATAQFSIVALSTASLSVGNRPSAILCTGTSFGINGAAGILQDTPSGGRAGTVRMAGISKCLATTSAAVALGAPITCTTGGMAMVADTTGQLVIGHCIVASTGLVTGSLCEVRLSGPFPFVLS